MKKGVYRAEMRILKHINAGLEATVDVLDDKIDELVAECNAVREELIAVSDAHDAALEMLQREQWKAEARKKAYDRLCEKVSGYFALQADLLRTTRGD